MYLGIEIGGTKLQLGIGDGTGGSLAALERRDVELSRGAAGIRQQIEETGQQLLRQYDVQSIGIGFGGPLDRTRGTIIRSFHVEGWDGFALRSWCQDTLQRPTVIENDANAAGLGEARYGAGRDAGVVFYSNIGTGIGGALITHGDVYHGGAELAVAEIGHLRPGPSCIAPDQIVESFASGLGLTGMAQEKLQGLGIGDAAYQDLLKKCAGDLQNLTAKIVFEAAAENNTAALDVVHRGIQTYGWALGTAITLLSPDTVVIGGGIAQAGDKLFLQPLREAVTQYVMPSLKESYRIEPAMLGEEVVVYGAIALADSGLHTSKHIGSII
jgi:glucokinase